jgi:uncharacterized membrane protein
LLKPRLVFPTIAVFYLTVLSPAPAQEAKARDAFQTKALPVLERYCVTCHSQEAPEAGIAFDRFRDQAAALEDGRTWLRVSDALEGHTMPPADEPQPSAKDRDALTGWIEGDFLTAQRGKQAGPAPW